ncbi:HEAT repeat domain-containing protein [Geoalkalibacter sp.]|uniref:HEAT repeat domain-containing protein n=1 Tax=Geoalkalibacter sp. TaxID=3041440 RepID=UPI00272EE505|nr:HEAT repeat domain-containing protein [Geoalkalibacter sp.]
MPRTCACCRASAETADAPEASGKGEADALMTLFQSPNGAHPAFDGKILERSLFALNIARHNAIAYPPEHPALQQSVERFLARLEELLEFREAITLGITRDRLLLDGAVLDEKNAVYRNLSGCFFDAGIASLTLRRTLTREELAAFLNALRPLQAADLDLFARLAAAGIQGLEARPFDFGALHATDLETIDAPPTGLPDTAGLTWESFSVALLNQTLDAEGSDLLVDKDVDPAQLADLLGRFAKDRDQARAGYENTIIAFLRRADQEEINNQARREFLDKLGAFIDKLAPGTRRQFLGSAFRYLGQRRDMTTEVLHRLSQETVLDILDSCEHQELEVPPLVLDLLGKLGECAAPLGDRRRVAAPLERDTTQLGAGVRRLFQRPETRGFVSAPYERLLRGLLATRPLHAKPPAELQDLYASLESHQLEARLCSVILEMVDVDPHGEDTAALETNLRDLLDYFLQTGDFQTLNATLRRLRRHGENAEPFAFPLAKQALEHLSGKDFLDTALDGFRLWEAERHAGIRELIRLVGAPFADPLLDRLAEESDLSLRRLYLACLEDLGPQARRAIVARLRDPRWFLVRNLVILLRRGNDPTVLKHLGALIGHPHPKVQYEVMKTLLHFDDSRAQRYLLRELGAPDLERRRQAVLLARNGAGPEVLTRLAAMLHEGTGEAEVELREQVIETLCQSSDRAAGQSLAQLLLHRSLRHPLLYRQLRHTVFEALRRQRPPWLPDLLRDLAASGTGGVHRQAGRLLVELLEQSDGS